jgi:hypothetical protein
METLESIKQAGAPVEFWYAVALFLFAVVIASAIIIAFSAKTFFKNLEGTVTDIKENLKALHENQTELKIIARTTEQMVLIHDTEIKIIREKLK